MATLHDIVTVEAEFTALLNNPRRRLSRFVEVSLEYGQLLAEQDPHRAVEALALAIETLHDPPAPAEVPVALGLLRAMRTVASRVGAAEQELDAITRERRILDEGLTEVKAGEREALCRRAAAVRFDEGNIDAAFRELMDGLRSCGTVGLEELATDLLLAVRRVQLPAELLDDLEALWVFLRRRRTDEPWALWSLVALGAVRLKVGDIVTAQMYMRRAATALGQTEVPVVASIIGGWVALAADDPLRAFDRFSTASLVRHNDDRVRLLVAAGLGESLLTLGRVDEARAPLAEAIAYDVGDPNTVARCHELLSIVAASDGRYRDAYEHLLLCRSLEEPSIMPERPDGHRRRDTVVDLREPGSVVSIAADPPLRSLSAEYGTPITTIVIAEPVIDLSDGAESAASAAVLLGSPAEEFGISTADSVAAAAEVGGVDLREDPTADRLVLHLAPIIENASGQIGAAEAVLRLVRSDGSVSDALALANRSELRRQVAMHTLRRACAVIASAGIGAQTLLVDLSEFEIDSVLVALVERELSAADADARHLVVLVSGARLGRSAGQSATLDALRSLGVGIGVTGLATAFTSPEVLLSCPVDVAMVHHEALVRAGNDGPSRRALEAAASLSAGFGFELIATGIENAAEFAAQVQLGCTGAQGPFVGETAPADVLVG